MSTSSVPIVFRKCINKYPYDIKIYILHYADYSWNTVQNYYNLKYFKVKAVSHVSVVELNKY